MSEGDPNDPEYRERLAKAREKARRWSERLPSRLRGSLVAVRPAEDEETFWRRVAVGDLTGEDEEGTIDADPD